MEKAVKTKKAAQSVMALAEKIVSLSYEKDSVELSGELLKYAKAMSAMLGITPMQCLFLSVFIDQFEDSHISYRDIARHFGVRTIAVLSKFDDIDALVKRGIVVKRTDSDGDESFRVPSQTINMLRVDKLPEPAKTTDLTPDEVMDYISDQLDLRESDELADDVLYQNLHMILDSNIKLPLCANINSLKLDDSDLVLFLAMSHRFVTYQDDNIVRGDLKDYFGRGCARSHLNLLSRGEHNIMKANLVEFVCEDGKACNERWKLTNYAKNEVLDGLNLSIKTDDRSNVLHYDIIKAKQMYYNDRVTESVESLRHLLDVNKMKSVMNRLKAKGLRCGFTCLFYGAPGTGKTETVMQLARLSGRDIMQVDVPSIRSKWVGETEQNIKAVFERYRRLTKDNDKAPILLFNEADALLNKRFEGGVNAVDKMENAMQNIILQEMENLEGIMIATTNLTGSLDAAFERRFLYKIEFDKPTPKERCHIWQAMLPELTDSQALHLAEKYDFSGGQIENIARKQTISSILADEDGLNLARIEADCQQERLQKQKTQRIGFYEK